MTIALADLSIIVVAASLVAAPAVAMPTTSKAPALVDAAFVRPLYGSFKHCEGACLKNGSLSWFCFQKQDCYLSCASAPPTRKCAIP